ncbi:glycoside hydrolase family 15 protein [Nocardioides koreensis]|uniref:Glycoside hydrolase family 15 protein n=1 Tax=Nocardioides koreensis TaxID=433651 RepID=A0ABN2ZL57_9ACTN
MAGRRGWSSGSRYLPIAEHGLIGDLHTVALVGTDGTIDWYCCPRFDSPSVFAAILDADRGGRFRIAPDHDGWSSRQLYLPDTNVLITRFLMPQGVGEVQDFMPPASGRAAHRHRIVRRVVAVRGQLRFLVEVAPRFDYARGRHEVALTDHGAVFRSSDLVLSLSASRPLEIVDGRDVGARVELRAGEAATYVLDRVEPGEAPPACSDADVEDEFVTTVAFWRSWIRRSSYSGRWREMVDRSALTLKLLTYAPTGAIVAAPTTSLPEELGGVRNWDYRYTWMRDAAFSLYALLRLGFDEEAGAFMQWLEGRFRHATGRDSGPLQIMYGVDGREDLAEQELPHLEGYRGSAPVRIGNGAAHQLQLDIYGELMDAVYLCNKYGRPLYHDGWMELTRNLEWLMDHWDQPDEGIWETRGGRRDYTYSRLMSWVAVERAVRVALQRGLPADVLHWMAVRDAIYNQIIERGWNPTRRAFVQHYDSDVLDASLLLMPLCKFIAPTDPRWLSTLDAITEELVSDSLVRRYDADASPDGLTGTEATFSMCSFWWVEALARAGRLDEARLAFEKMLTYANHVGLYSEEIGPTGEQLGNFPQAFTHLALISAAYDLDRRLG